MMSKTEKIVVGALILLLWLMAAAPIIILWLD